MSLKLFPANSPDPTTLASQTLRAVPHEEQPVALLQTIIAPSPRLVRTFARGANTRGRRSLVIGLAVLGATNLPDAQAETQRVQAVNVLPLTMRMPRQGFNRMVISLDVCAPGSAQCVTIDDVMVDTGSTGLRIEPGMVPASMHLPPVLGRGSAPLGECVRFVHDQAWGKLVRVDLHLGGLVAADVPVQLISSDDEPHPPECPVSGVFPTSNATLGIGSQTDCPDLCDGTDPGASYFACPDDGCRLVGAETPDRLSNPVARLPRHNNGVVFDLPSAPPDGTRAVTGTLILGVGTADNNRLDGTRLLRLDGFGRFTTVLFGRPYPLSSIDSGAAASIVPGDGVGRCASPSWALCESPARRFDAELVGSDGGRLTASFRVGDFAALTGSGIGAADGVAVSAPSSSRGFVWGAPLFLGKRVAFGFETAGGGRAFYGFTDRP